MKLPCRALFAVRVTFVDEGSAPAVLVHLIPSGSELDDSFRFGNARPICRDLLGDKGRFANLRIGQRRASTDGQQADMDTSLLQAVASV